MVIAIAAPGPPPMPAMVPAPISDSLPRTTLLCKIGNGYWRAALPACQFRAQ